MKSFFKFMFASMLGFILTIVLFLFLVGGIVGAVIRSTTDDKVEVENKTILTMDLSQGVVDRAGNNPFDEFNVTTMKAKKSLGLNEILKGLEKAKTDDNIKGIYLNTMGVNAGIATIEEIRNALIDFKTSGKFIISYADIYTQGSYYLSTVSDKIYLNPQGFVEFKGLSAQVMFYRDALEKVGVEPVIVRGKNNKFKSAVEPFMLSEMSDANREQTLTYMGSIWNHLLEGISATRGITVAELNQYADNMNINSADDALKYSLVDALKYDDEVNAELKSKSETDADNDINFLSIKSYNKAPKTSTTKISKEKIAVIYATGEINMGEGSDKSIGSEGTSKAIRKAREDEKVKAIVLRVNSPGGSALASEVIWREMILAKAEKPIVVSMGDVAASGGYYISAPANKIFANPTTITGSIGVFGMMWNGTDLMKKVGIHTSVVNTNSHSDFGNMTRKMTDGEYATIQKGVEETYGTFLQHVAEGRNTTKEAVDAIGQGRVWSGTNAKEIGLIDEFGGLTDAIAYAKELAELEDGYRLVEYPEQKDPVETLIKEFGLNVKANVIEDELGENYRYYQQLHQLTKIKGIQARMPYAVEIK